MEESANWVSSLKRVNLNFRKQQPSTALCKVCNNRWEKIDAAFNWIRVLFW